MTFLFFFEVLQEQMGILALTELKRNLKHFDKGTALNFIFLLNHRLNALKKVSVNETVDIITRTIIESVDHSATEKTYRAIFIPSQSRDNEPTKKIESKSDNLFPKRIADPHQDIHNR